MVYGENGGLWARSHPHMLLVSVVPMTKDTLGGGVDYPLLATFFQWLGVTCASDPSVPCAATGFHFGVFTFSTLTRKGVG